MLIWEVNRVGHYEGMVISLVVSRELDIGALGGWGN